MWNASARALRLLVVAGVTASISLAQGDAVEPPRHYEIFGSPLLSPFVPQNPQSGNAKERRYVLLAQPGKDSAFRRQGLQHLDLITDVVRQDGAKRLSDLGPFQAAHFVRLVTGLPEGTEVTLEFIRYGKPGQKQTRNFRIPRMDPREFADLKRAYAESYFFAGALLASLPAEVAHFHGEFRENDGLLVAAIYPEGALFKAGARRGDALFTADPARNPAPCMFPSVGSLLQCLDRFAEEGPLRFTFIRGAKGIVAPLTVPPGILADIRQTLRQRNTLPPETPAAAPPGIESVAIEPQPVGAGQPFAVRVVFSPGSGGGKPGVPGVLQLRILAGARVLLAEKPVSIAPDSGTLLEHTYRLKAANQPGAFVVEVSLEDPSHRDTKSVALRVE
ncbi:MAG: hypothetical protein U5J83_18735 [Bryobacterales bacterium]|nr:hypothetical protein [Bryobacterales bacterium]